MLLIHTLFGWGDIHLTEDDMFCVTHRLSGVREYHDDLLDALLDLYDEDYIDDLPNKAIDFYDNYTHNFW